MADRPIPFSPAMVRALLAGTKTQTRRVMNPQPYPNGFKFDAELGDILCHNDYLPPATLLMDKGTGEKRYTISDVEDGIEAFSRIAAGDRLYVREHWRTTNVLDDIAPRDLKATEDATINYTPIQYEADGATVHFNAAHDPGFGRFRQAMHMPKWASRTTLHVTEVRVQRLQEISDADAVAEGIELVRDSALWGKRWRNYGAKGYDDRSPIYSYRTLWNSLRRHTGEHQLPVEPWSENPWVTATTFEVELCHIDQARA